MTMVCDLSDIPHTYESLFRLYLLPSGRAVAPGLTIAMEALAVLNLCSESYTLLLWTDVHCVAVRT